MNKQDWIRRAYARFVDRGIEAGEDTQHWAEHCWHFMREGSFENSPEDAVDKELLASDKEIVHVFPTTPIEKISFTMTLDVR